MPTTTEDGVPTTTEECGRLAEEIREIDAVANYLQRELEKIRAARAAKAARRPRTPPPPEAPDADADADADPARIHPGAGTVRAT